MNMTTSSAGGLTMSRRKVLMRQALAKAGTSSLFLVAAASAVIVLFIIFYIFQNSIPFFKSRGIVEFLTSSHWYPSHEPAEFGALAIFTGSLLVTIGAVFVAAPLGIVSAVCLSDIVNFSVRQWIKPVTEILAAIPSVAYGFFALVVLAPFMQAHGGYFLDAIWKLIAVPCALLLALILATPMVAKVEDKKKRRLYMTVIFLLFSIFFLFLIQCVSSILVTIEISSGTNALNVSLVLAVMSLPTVVSVSEDSLQSVGRELREGSYALGATRAETMLKVIIPAASSGILAAVLLGIMRALGETMIVWMASGNASKIPSPIFNYLEPVRTLTATIAGDMGEADHVTGSDRYHVLFAMGFSLLLFSFVLNLVSEKIAASQRGKLRGK
jgi:phosphate transport system permease protein